MTGATPSLGHSPLTPAMLACLRKLAEQTREPMGGWCNYGTGCGVKRNVVRALAARGLAELDDERRPGVSARATDKGRAFVLGGRAA